MYISGGWRELECRELRVVTYLRTVSNALGNKASLQPPSTQIMK